MKRFLFVSVAHLSALLAIGCKLSVSQPAIAQHAVNWPAAKTGAMIVQVRPNSAGAHLGLVRGDIIVGFNGIKVSDFNQLGVIQDRALQDASLHAVELVLFRNQQPIPVVMKIPNSRLGIVTTDWTLARTFVYDALINHEDQEKAEKLVAAADASHDYNRRQILHMKVLVIPNGATPQDDTRRRQMTESLIQQYGLDEVCVMAAWELLTEKRDRAATSIFKLCLAAKPDDTDATLNLASAYAHTAHYEEAEDLLRQPQVAAETLGSYGREVRRGIEANILLGRRDLDAAIPRLHHEALNGDLYSNFEYLFAVAETGDLERFREAKADMQRRDPFLITAAPYHIDLLEAHALELGGKKTEAAAIIRKWSNNADARLYIPKFWLGVPNGQDVIDTWNRMK